MKLTKIQFPFGKLIIFVIASYIFLIHNQTAYSQKYPVIQFKQDKWNFVSNTGYQSIKWIFPSHKEADIVYKLEQSTHKDFKQSKLIYLGTDTGSYLSGLAEGVYYFRVRAQSKNKKVLGQWSSPLKLTVKYQSMTLAWSLFVIGAIIFLAITFVIIRGSIVQNKDI